jgi:hypothetical protein
MDRDKNQLLGAFCCLLSQIKTIDALNALVNIVSQSLNAGYDDGFNDGRKPTDERNDA